MTKLKEHEWKETLGSAYQSRSRGFPIVRSWNSFYTAAACRLVSQCLAVRWGREGVSSAAPRTSLPAAPAEPPSLPGIPSLTTLCDDDIGGISEVRLWL